MRRDPRYILSSLTRLSDLSRSPFQERRIDRVDWETGDYVVGEVYGTPSSLYRIELGNGRMMPVAEGDLVVGALGKRAATLETTGDWERIGDDGKMTALTGAGLFGAILSRSSMMPPFLKLEYRGHIVRNDTKTNMRDFVKHLPERKLEAPVILLIGSSMSSGKTTTARVLVRLLKRMGRSVMGAKLTGAGRFRDVLSLYDAGADHIIDFVDVGLPSTVCGEAVYRDAARQLLSRVAELQPDVVVAEIGASPLEPYNGAAAIEMIKSNLIMTVLCASDPYAAVGVREAFGHRPDLISGVTTNTAAGIELVERLTGVPALNILNKESLPRLEFMLRQKLSEIVA